MAEDPERPDIPQATVVPRRRARISVVWIIPILAAVVAIGIAVQRILSEGPTITIVFKIAEGIEAGKTAVKYKDVNIGQVTAVRLSPDYSKVEVTAKIAKTAAGLIVEDAKFWVVEPRVTLSGVSGLGTLLSGNYIGFEVGKSGKKQRTFIGLETPPIITYGQAGRQFVLKAETLGSLGIGSPVYYRRLLAGQVVAYELAPDGKGLDIRVFVNAPYDPYVTSGTRFWNASGIDVSLGANGVAVRTESLVAVLAGGLAFDTSPGAAKTEPAPADSTFTLHADRAAAMKEPDTIATRYVLYFNETLRGLSVGAPLTLLGLPAGEVTEIGLDIDPGTSRIRGRVEVVAYPQRLIARLGAQQAAMGQHLTQSATQRHALLQELVEKRGVRAQLRSGNLLTGQLFVALDYFPDAPKAKIDWTEPVPALPVVPSTLPDLEAKLSSIVAKLDKLPLEEIGADVTKALASLNNTLNGAGKLLNNVDTDVMPELKTTLEEARRMIATADGLLKDGVNGTLDQLNTTLEELRRPLATADAVLKNADVVLSNTDATLLGKNAPIQQDLRDALQEVTLAARSLRVLMDYLERHPDSLLRGKVMRRLALVAILGALAPLVTGCAATPSSQFFTLSAVPGPAAPSSDLSVAVGPIAIPASVDRPQIVVAVSPNQVRLDEFNRWVSPLQNNIGRVVAENLVAMLGTPRVTLSPQLLAADVNYRVGIEVQTFESAPGQAATLDAVWVVARTVDGRSRTGRTTVREPAPQPGYEALAAAHSRAVARLSRDIADAVGALDRSR